MKKANAMLIAEFLGTFLLTVAVLKGANPYVTLGILVLVVGSISGAHVNPAVSGGLALINKLKPETMYWYWAAQIAGALVGRSIYDIITPGVTVAPLATASPTTMQGFIAEVLGAAIFLFGITMAISQRLTGVTLAVAVGGSLFLGATFGGVLNPAVALGIGNLSFATLAGPLIGGALGAWLANTYMAGTIAQK